MSAVKTVPPKCCLEGHQDRHVDICSGTWPHVLGFRPQNSGGGEGMRQLSSFGIKLPYRSWRNETKAFPPPLPLSSLNEEALRMIVMA